MRSYIQTRPQPPPIEIDYCDDDDDDGDDDDDYFHNVEYKPLVVWLLQSFPDLRWWQTKMNIPGHKYSLNICVQVSDSQDSQTLRLKIQLVLLVCGPTIPPFPGMIRSY